MLTFGGRHGEDVLAGLAVDIVLLLPGHPLYHSVEGIVLTHATLSSCSSSEASCSAARRSCMRCSALCGPLPRFWMAESAATSEGSENVGWGYLTQPLRL